MKNRNATFIHDGKEAIVYPFASGIQNIPTWKSLFWSWFWPSSLWKKWSGKWSKWAKIWWS
ncbi:MAG: hypothetical protein A3K03_12415 [Bdellovibrionales bacterium RIFOXYD1_FULL_44_7]|nr:MAG: hypothetical protein A3K03_12415 [Bdellovibrionales bacterium RIFOXYD1_FULL_44_7]